MTVLFVTPLLDGGGEPGTFYISDGQTEVDILGVPPDGIYLVEFTPPIVPRENAYIPGPEGQRRVRSRPQNAVGSARLRIDQSQSDAVAFQSDVDALQKMIESAHKRKGTLTFTPPNLRQVTYDIESCQITEAPADGPRMTKRILEFVLEFECRPYGRLEPVTVFTNQSLTGPIDGIEIPNVAGHVDALGELTLTDASSANADFVEFGIGQQGYDSDDELVITLSDTTAITDEPTVCATIGSGHGGRQKIAAVLSVGEDDIWVRFGWRLDGGALSYGRWIGDLEPGGDREVTLAVIELGAATEWSGQIEAFAGDGSGSITIEQVFVIPAEVCGRIRAAGDQHALDAGDSVVFTHEGVYSNGARFPLDGDTLRIPAATAAGLPSLLVVRRRQNDIDAGLGSLGKDDDLTATLEITPRVALY